MALSPRELEDDIIIAHSEVRLNPEILIHELQNIVNETNTYYTPSTHMATLIGERDLKDIARETIDQLRRIAPTNALIHCRELELAARDFQDSYKPDYDLSTRVKQYTNWEGEINEIVHYSKATARGIDVLVNLVLSDFVGDTKNIETIFNQNYRYFGVRVSSHDLHDYCVVIIYAEEIFSTLKSALYTSSHIDEELLYERETLGRKVAQNSNYHYSARFARDHPSVHMDIYKNSANKSKRKVRLTEDQDGDRTFTVIRRDSLERNTNYRNHDDADYQYVNEQNERFTHVPSYARPQKRYFTLDKGERIIRQTITDHDRELYSKHITPGDTYVKYEWNGDPHKDRYTVPHWKDYDSKLYYGDINDISRFEENVVGRYSTIIPESCPGNHNEVDTTPRASSKYESQRSGSFRRAKTPRKTVEQALYEPENKLHDEVKNTNFSFRHRNQLPANDGIEVSYHEEEYYSPRESSRPVSIRGSGRHGSTVLYEPTGYGRYTGTHQYEEPAEIKRTASFGQEREPAQPISSYRMVERESIRDSSRRSNRVQLRPQTVVVEPQGRDSVGTFTKAEKFEGVYSPDKSIAGRPTTFSSVHKRRTKAQNNEKYDALNELDISDSF